MCIALSLFTPHRPSLPRSLKFQIASTGLLLLAIGSSMQAQSIDVPNGSFESPTPPAGYPATPQVDVWQKSTQPVWFDPATTGGITWNQLSGVFPNPPAGDSKSIDNVNGQQAAYLFALPQVGLLQSSLDAIFVVGHSYSLTVGLLGGGGIPDGATFSIGLFFLDGADKLVSVGSTTATFSAANFPTVTHLIDYQLNIPEVKSTDAYAGHHIGVELLSTSGTGAGYWDVDNIRLTAVPEPSTLVLASTGLGGLLILTQRARRRA